MTEPLHKAEEAVTHKVGGVPLWVWVVVAVGGGIVVYLVFLRGGAAQPATLPGSGSGMGTGGGSGGGGGSSPTTTSDIPAVTPLNNSVWLQRAIGEVVKRTGMDPAVVSLYLRQYLNGRMPVGSSTAQSDFSRVIATAIDAVGSPGSPPAMADPNTNPFLANSDWLANALGFLPSGTSGSVRNELIAFFNGNATSAELSQAAADALEGARRILGYEPRVLQYTIKQVVPVDLPRVPVPPPPDTPPSTKEPFPPSVIPPVVVKPPIIPPIIPQPPDTGIPKTGPIVVPPAVPPVVPPISAPTLPAIPPVIAPIIPPAPAAPVAPTPVPVDRTSGWGKLINDAYAEVFNRSATDSEIWDWAAKMKSGAVPNIRQAIIDFSISIGPPKVGDANAGWGKIINDAFNFALFRNATQQEIWSFANRMQSGELGTWDKIVDAVAALRRRIAS